jgi:hypothetical protein
VSQPLHVDIVTETFPPEVNGVAMTLGRLTAGLQSLGHTKRVFRPRQFRHETARYNGTLNEHLPEGVRLPMYRDLQLGLPAAAWLAEHWRRHLPPPCWNFSASRSGQLNWESRPRATPQGSTGTAWLTVSRPCCATQRRVCPMHRLYELDLGGAIGAATWLLP